MPSLQELIPDLIEFDPRKTTPLGDIPLSERLGLMRHRKIGGHKPAELWKVWEELFDPEFSESMRKTARSMKGASKELQKGIKVVTQSLRDVIPSKLDTDIVEMMVRKSFSDADLKRLTQFGNPKAVRAVLWDTLNKQKQSTPLGYVFRGFMRGPSFQEASPIGGKRVNWEDMSEKELRRRFVEGRSVKEGPKLPIREMPEETLERGKAAAVQKATDASKKALPPAGEMKLGTLKAEHKLLKDEFYKLSRQMKQAGGDLFEAAMGESEIDPKAMRLFLARQQTGRAGKITVPDPVGRAKMLLDRLGQIERTTYATRGPIADVTRMDVLSEVRQKPFAYPDYQQRKPKMQPFGKMDTATQKGLAGLVKGGGDKLNLQRLASVGGKALRGGLLTLPLLLMLLSSQRS